ASPEAPAKPPVQQEPVLRAQDLEAKAQQARDFLSSQRGDVGKRFRRIDRSGKPGGNVAVGELTVDGRPTPLQAFSGTEDIEGQFAKYVPNDKRKLGAGGAKSSRDAPGYVRDLDSEAKILEHALDMTSPESKAASLRLFTEREPCDACAQMIEN